MRPDAEADAMRLGDSAAPGLSLHTLAAERAAAKWGTKPARVLVGALNVGRRFFGPFPWVAPERWDFWYLQSHGVLMYPGVLCWYALLPLIAVGWLNVTDRLRREPRLPFAIPFFWSFVIVYLAPYVFLDFNYLPYRQRDAILPILVVVALAGFSEPASVLRLRRWYLAFGVALLVVAASHIALRAWLAS